MLKSRLNLLIRGIGGEGAFDFDLAFTLSQEKSKTQ